MTSSRRLEQRIREDLAFRYLAAGATLHYWALNEFRKRHGLGINDAFTQVVELTRALGMGKLGQVAPGPAGMRVLGTALLRAHHATLDRDGMPAYLEASDMRTRRLYLAHGYAACGGPLFLPGAVVHVPMWRQPQPQQTQIRSTTCDD